MLQQKEKKRQDTLARECTGNGETSYNTHTERDKKKKRQGEMKRKVAMQRERQEKERQAALEREKQERILLEKKKKTYGEDMKN